MNLNSNIEIHKFLFHISYVLPYINLNSNIEIHKSGKRKKIMKAIKII